MLGLQKHHRMGGLQASLYNAAPVESGQALTAFMAPLQQQRGACWTGRVILGT
jgi:phosphoserine aminotransferase